MEWVLVEQGELTGIWQLVGILGPRQHVGSGLILKIDQTEQSVTCWGKVPPRLRGTHKNPGLFWTMISKSFQR